MFYVFQLITLGMAAFATTDITIAVISTEGDDDTAAAVTDIGGSVVIILAAFSAVIFTAIDEIGTAKPFKDIGILTIAGRIIDTIITGQTIIMIGADKMPDAGEIIPSRMTTTIDIV